MLSALVELGACLNAHKAQHMPYNFLFETRTFTPVMELLYLAMLLGVCKFGALAWCFAHSFMLDKSHICSVQWRRLPLLNTFLLSKLWMRCKSMKLQTRMQIYTSDVEDGLSSSRDDWIVTVQCPSKSTLADPCKASWFYHV